MGGTFSSGSGDKDGKEVSEASSVDSGLLSDFRTRFLGARSVLVRRVSLEVRDACEDERRDVLLAESEWMDKGLASLLVLAGPVLSVMADCLWCRHLVILLVSTSIARRIAVKYLHDCKPEDGHRPRKGRVINLLKTSLKLEESSPEQFDLSLVLFCNLLDQRPRDLRIPICDTLVHDGHSS